MKFIARLIALIATAIFLAAPAGATAAKSWPPRDGKGLLFAHFGEEHITDADGPTILPKVVHEVIRYGPRMVTMSGDKANNGEPEEFEPWLDVMRRFDRAAIPWFASVGNHDRTVPDGYPGGTPPNTSSTVYREFFADRPYPLGDAKPYPVAELSPKRRPASDPNGAATHYFVDYGPTRWIFIDNSCFSIIFCDQFQNPSGQNADEPQFAFLERTAKQAQRQGRLAFVVMHIPTRDPRDQSYADPISYNHVMGKGILDAFRENATFEEIAQEAGVDAVLLGHIKGQFLYEGMGGIPYYVDGGAGGELYTLGPVGVDHGYWHGFRLLRVRGGKITRTDTVPILIPRSIEIEGPSRLTRGSAFTYEAFGRQPVFNDPAKVEHLELRDPDPIRPAEDSGSFLPALRWIGPPLGSLLLIAAIAAARSPSRRRRYALTPGLVLAVGTVAWGGISAAQQSEPTTTPRKSLPNPARIWTSSNPLVLKPIPSKTDDSRRDRATQTADGRFRAVCPGKARLSILSGFEKSSVLIKVKRGDGPLPERCE